ncbi:hypothetical protein BFW86_01320 [Pseudomonas fluorescens]|nr:hypothetical protein BFW86_01320 [Pseudomonas fluorescens]
MSTSSAQRYVETFTATLNFANKVEPFKANRVEIQESTDIAGIRCWTIKAFEDRLNSATATWTINTLRIHLAKGHTTGRSELAPALRPPDLRADSAGYYKLDSPANNDDEIDTALQFPSLDGSIIYTWTPGNKNLSAVFIFRAAHPDKTSFRVCGNFSINNNGSHSI